MKIKDFYDYGISFLSFTFGIENIENALGIILLCLSILNILVKGAFKLSDRIKQKKIEEIPKIIDDTINEIKEVKENVIK